MFVSLGYAAFSGLAIHIYIYIFKCTKCTNKISARLYLSHSHVSLF